MTTINFDVGMLRLPKHIALELGRNPHLETYDSVRDWLAYNDFYDFQSDDHQQRAIADNEIWTLHWYPNTPVGFIAIAAPTLPELLAFAIDDDGA